MEKTGSSRKENTVLFFTAFVCLGLICLYVFAGHKLFFATNDDVMLKAILTGDITGSPDAHLIYVMYPLGWLLKSLYTINAKVPWYDGFITVLHLAVYFLVMFRTGRIFASRKIGERILLTVLAGVVIFTIDFPYLIWHQYTSLAATVAAVSLYFYLTAEKREEGLHAGEQIVIGLFLLLSLWLRKQVFIMALPLLGLAFLLRLSGKFKAKRLILPGVLAVLIALSFLAEKKAYSSDEWQEFLAYNTYRTDVYDYYLLPPYEENVQEYTNLGIDEKDMFPLAEWDLGLFPGYQKENMKGMAELSGNAWKNLHYQKWEIKHTLKNVLNLILHQDIQPIGWILTAVTVLSIPGLFILKKKKAAFMVILSVLYEGAFVTYFTFRGRFPERVSYGLYLLEFIFIAGVWIHCLTNVGQTEESKRKNILPAVSIALLAVMAVVLVIRIVGFGKQYKQYVNKTDEWNTANTYFASHPENVYYVKTSSFASYGEEMFKESTYEGNNFLRIGSWIMGSPLYEKKVSALSLSGESSKALYKDANTYYVQDAVVGTTWLETFYADESPVITEEETVPLGEQKSMTVVSLKTEGN